MRREEFESLVNYMEKLVMGMQANSSSTFPYSGVPPEAITSKAFDTIIQDDEGTFYARVGQGVVGTSTVKGGVI